MSLSNLGSVVLVGAGQMGMAMAIGWLKAGLSPQNLTLVDPNPLEEVQLRAAADNISLVASPPEQASDVLILAVKPQIAELVLEQAKVSVGENTLVLSVMAGISVAQMSAALGTKRIVRTIPNTPSKIGKGAIGAFAGDDVTEQDRQIVNQLLDASGRNFWVRQEDDINSVTGVSGSGPAYVFFMVEALAKAAEAQGLDPELSMALARQTVVGAAALLDAEPENTAAKLRENVTSPNGTTFAGLQVLMSDQGLTPLMVDTVDAAAKRSQELGA